jgi:hypothetical protein
MLGGAFAPPDLSQLNPGAQDLATLVVSAPKTTDITSTPTAVGSQILGVNGLLLSNAAASGAVAQAPISAALIGTQGEVIATSGGSALTGGATGKNMPECMAAWDKATHITKPRWKEICARTMIEPPI